MAKAKEKMEALVPEEEQPYPVPANWRWVRLIDNCADCLDSFRKPINATERAERYGNIPYYGATGQVGWINDYLTNEELVLLGEDGAPFFDRNKEKAYMISGKAWVNNHAHILRSKYGHYGNILLMHYLNTFNYNGYVNGSTRLKLTQASMQLIPVPIPPINEQKRIFDRIESLFAKLDEAKEKAQAVVDGYENRKAAILHKAFTGELTEKWRDEHSIGRSSWKKTLVGDVCTDIKVGIVIKPSQYYAEKKTGTPAFRSANVREFYVEDNDWVYLNDEGMQQNKRSIVNTGDVLIVRSGNPGTACVVDEKYDGYNAIDILIAVPDTESVTSDYLCAYTNSPIGRNLVSVNKRGMALAHFNVSGYSKLEIEVPTIEEQQEITKNLFRLLEKEEEANKLAKVLIVKIDAMKKSILAKAFRGELGTNDPSEEPVDL